MAVEAYLFSPFFFSGREAGTERCTENEKTHLSLTWDRQFLTGFHTILLCGGYRHARIHIKHLLFFFLCCPPSPPGWGLLVYATVWKSRFVTLCGVVPRHTMKHHLYQTDSFLKSRRNNTNPDHCLLCSKGARSGSGQVLRRKGVCSFWHLALISEAHLFLILFFRFVLTVRRTRS